MGRWIVLYLIKVMPSRIVGTWWSRQNVYELGNVNDLHMLSTWIYMMQYELWTVAASAIAECRLILLYRCSITSILSTGPIHHTYLLGNEKRPCENYEHRNSVITKWRCGHDICVCSYNTDNVLHYDCTWYPIVILRHSFFSWGHVSYLD